MIFTRPRFLTTLLVFAVLVCSATLGLAQTRDSSAPPAERLKFVIIFSRHGVRAPTASVEQLNQYSSEPWPKWDVPPGYLTPQGSKLMTVFGNYYRSYFAEQGLFEADGCAEAADATFYADSDQRTRETAHSLAKGMFPGCTVQEHAYSEGQADPLFHSLSSGIGHADPSLAAAAIAGRIGEDPGNVTEAYRLQLEALQRILLGCAPKSPCPQPGHTAAKLLLNVPASLDAGKGDHMAELKGPLNTAATITEDILLEYTNGLPSDQVGWGRVDLSTLKQLMDLHTAASDLTRRTPYLATVQASNTLAHILQTLEQAIVGKEARGALGAVGDRAVVLVGHDTNLANVAAMLNLSWIIDGRRDDTPPGGALVFALWQRAEDSSYIVRVYYTSQTLEQMRNVTPLTIERPPARAAVFIPNCSSAASGFPCEWKAFHKTVETAIDPAFVK